MSENPRQLTRAKLKYARELIYAKQYAEARSILQTLDHPTARAWLRKLDRGEYSQILTYSSDSSTDLYFSSKPLAKKKRSNTLLAILVIPFLCIAMFSLARFEQPTIDISQRMLSIRPDTIEITDPYNTGIPESFLEHVRNTFAQFGYVQYYEGIILSSRRFRTDLQIVLANSGNQTNTALKVIEDILRLYAREFNETNNGEAISARVYWMRDGNQCATGVGMGYHMMENINWQNVTQSQIFQALDRDVYPDSSTVDFGDLAWKPSITGMDICRRS